MRRGCRWLLSRVLIVISTILLTLLVLELGLRLFMPQQLIVTRPDVFVPAENGIGHRHQANLDTIMNTGERNARLITNADGQRIGANPPLNPQYRILALGDSFLAALQVDYEASFAGLLETQLSAAAGATVEIVNTGVNGYQPDHYLIMARQMLAHDPNFDLVAVFVYTGNDVIGSRVAVYPPLAPRTVYPLRIPTALTRQEIVNAVLYPLNDFLEANSHLYVFAKDRARTLLARQGLIYYNFPNSLLRTTADDPMWDVTVTILQDIATTAQLANIPTVFIIVPSMFEVDPSQVTFAEDGFGVKPSDFDWDQARTILTTRLTAQGLTVLDLTPPLRAALAATPTTPLYGRVDIHLAPTGHQVTAAYLTPLLIPYLTE
jgi:hypothetical protein